MLWGLAINSNGNGWKITKEKILFFSGLVLIGFEAITPFFSSTAFRFEVVLAGLALCGVSIAQWGDKGEK